MTITYNSAYIHTETLNLSAVSCVNNTWLPRWTWPSAVNSRRRPSLVDHTQRPALCTARWAIGRDGVAWTLGVSWYLFACVFVITVACIGLKFKVTGHGQRSRSLCVLYDCINCVVLWVLIEGRSSRHSTSARVWNAFYFFAKWVAL